MPCSMNVYMFTTKTPVPGTASKQGKIFSKKSVLTQMIIFR